MEELPQKRTNQGRHFEVSQSKDSYVMSVQTGLKSEDSSDYKAVSISNFTIEEIVSHKKKEKLRQESIGFKLYEKLDHSSTA
jgi:hypothetical protein